MTDAPNKDLSNPDRSNPDLSNKDGADCHFGPVQLDDAEARLTAETERHILAAMHGGCSIPLGAYSHIDGDMMTICAVISDPEGERYIKRIESCPVSEAKETAEKLVEQLFEAGAQQILDGIRNEG